LKAVIISDTHRQHDQIILPDGDILIHCGDFSNQGIEDDINKFIIWLEKQPHKNKIVIPGNHDRYVERNLGKSQVMFKCIGAELLINEFITIDGIKFYGSPYTPEFFNWAFMYNRQEAPKIWDKVPKDIDVLISHGPPWLILDQTIEGKNVGCNYLRATIEIIAPKFSLFGHIHESYGQMALQHGQKQTTYINASICNRQYQPVNNPVVIDL
jgi:Icc-related predicted phosphoesterase